ncbi:MAG: electron transfer flavoprotein subunit alpha [Eggerthellaceae bacterium]|jgi:electron transfer flavoprotein alpha subunit|nr:electron transfer flavoprotein subunit alpha [Eggerthellaceae bacterium]
MEQATWVIAEKPQDYPALCAIARTLGVPVTAVWAGAQDDCAAVAGCGADKVLCASLADGELYEQAFGAVVEAAQAAAPRAVLLASTKRLRLGAARLGVALGTKAVNDAASITLEDGALVTERMVYGGSANCRERMAEGTAIVLVSEGLLAAQQPAGGADAPVEMLPAAAPSAMALVERSPRTVEAVNLAAARRIVSVGRGIRAKDDLQMIDALAALLEAEVGCTRPLAEGEDWLSRERYIGVSGVMANPDLFIALGLSGQVQHMVGASGSRTIVVVNKDKAAPVFKYADYGIVGDLYEVVPALSAALA